jgi:hypothetical protein
MFRILRSANTLTVRELMRIDTPANSDMPPTTTFARFKERARALFSKRKELQEQPQHDVPEPLSWNTEYARYMEEVRARQPDMMHSVGVSTRVSRTDAREPKSC